MFTHHGHLQGKLERKCISKLCMYMPKARTRKAEKVDGRRHGRAIDKEVEEAEIGITEEVETRNREEKTA